MGGSFALGWHYGAQPSKFEGNILLVPKGETELIDAINAVLEEVNEQGLYAQWREEATELAKTQGLEVDG